MEGTPSVVNSAVFIKSPQRLTSKNLKRYNQHGPGLTLMTPRWIRPTIVKKDNGPLVESRIYDVQNPPAE